MKNFSLNEFRCKCCKELPADAWMYVEHLVNNVLDPVRDAFGKPIKVNSGYRCEKHNKEVGGAKNSQHLCGQATDVHCEDNRKLAKVIVENGRFDQLILYPTFIHVSWKRQGRNRQQILKKVGNGYEALSRKEVLGV